MSRLTLPFMSQDQGCFCCPPPLASTAPRHVEMRRDDGVCHSAISQHKAVPGHHVVDCKRNQRRNCVQQSSDASSLNSMLQRIHLSSQNETAGKESSISFQLPKDEASPIEPSGYSPSSIFQAQGMDVRVDFKSLQSRQFGGRPCPKSFLSTSAPSVRSKDCQEKSSCSSISSDMELDQALDELGMLSTITQSRRNYLLEMRGSASAMKRERRLRSKSESSPNLSSLTRLNGYRVVHLDSNYVRSVCSSSSPVELSSPSAFPMPDLSTLPVKSQMARMEYRNPDILEASSLARRRRSVPRMSRLRTARYWRSRCPYKIPNRLCHSMQEGDFDLEAFQNSHNLFSSSTTSLPDDSREQSAVVSDLSKGELGQAVPSSLPSHAHSKSNSSSPIKPCLEQPLARSLSVEDLHSAPARKLALLFDVQTQSKKAEDQARLEQVASQFTDLHMS